MTNAMLTLFKSQLESESKSLGDNGNLRKRGDLLIWWYFIRLHSFSSEEVEEIYCDGGGDLGIDAIWIDDENVVHFYNFKNPEKATTIVDAGDIDKTISGLHLVIDRNHSNIANNDLKDRVAEIYSIVPKGYVIHIVTSGAGIPSEAEIKLDSLVQNLGPRLFSWRREYLSQLHDQFYTRHIPSVEAPLIFKLQGWPHIVRSGKGDCYFFSADGSALAEVYKAHGEGLLERNIRVDQGDTATNKSIGNACTTDVSANFVHYNNGVTFVCRNAEHDAFNHQMRLEGSQIVNGGQTIRALSRAYTDGRLRSDVIVPVRAITGSNDKDFANEVAVNQNNQNRMGSGFLRATDARVVQLGHTLASSGWLLETRPGEVEAFTQDEVLRAEHRIGQKLEGRVIRLKDGLQAYVATFFRNPELAKKNVGQIFASTEDGGHFEKIFSDLTADKFVIAYLLKVTVDDFVRRFSAKKRRKDRVADWKEDYRTVLGDEIVNEFSDVVDQMVPQCCIFICGILFAMWDRSTSESPADDASIQRAILRILKYAKNNPAVANKGWPSLLKSKSFFDSFIGAMKESEVIKKQA